MGDLVAEGDWEHDNGLQVFMEKGFGLSHETWRG